MKLEQSFDVKAPIDVVWKTLVDVELVAPCLPGAKITGSDNGVYQGDFQVKVGPTTASYRGSLEMKELDEASHTATMSARGQDKRGQGSANATIVSSLSETGEGTHVEVVTDFTITGALARFGRGGMMQDIANRLLRDFASCLEKRIGSEQPTRQMSESEVAAAVKPGATAPEVAPEVAQSPPAAPPAEHHEHTPPVKAISLFFSVLWERIKRFFGRLFGRG
ncbi:MAG: SRPBCC family protein [Thermoleophilaceae bacterium]